MKTPLKTSIRALAKNKKKAGRRLVKFNCVDHGYQEAWQRFHHVSAQLSRLWKTKKNSLQILKAERTR